MSKYTTIYDALVEKTRLKLQSLRYHREAALEESCRYLKDSELTITQGDQMYCSVATRTITLPVRMSLRYADQDNVYATAIEVDLTAEESNRIFDGVSLDEILGSQKEERYRHYLYIIPLNKEESGNREITKRRIASDCIYFGKEIVCHAGEYRETETQFFFPSYAKCGEWYSDNQGKLCTGDDFSAGIMTHITHDGCEPYLVEFVYTDYMADDILEVTHLWTKAKRSYLLPKDLELEYESIIIVEGELYYHHGDSLYRGSNNKVIASGFAVRDETFDAETWELVEGIVPSTYFISNGESICQRQDLRLSVMSLTFDRLLTSSEVVRESTFDEESIPQELDFQYSISDDEEEEEIDVKEETTAVIPEDDLDIVPSTFKEPFVYREDELHPLVKDGITDLSARIIKKFEVLGTLKVRMDKGGV